MVPKKAVYSSVSLRTAAKMEAILILVTNWSQIRYRFDCQACPTKDKHQSRLYVLNG